LKVVHLRDLTRGEEEKRLAPGEPQRASRPLAHEGEGTPAPVARRFLEIQRAAREERSRLRAGQVRVQVEVGRLAEDAARGGVVADIEVEAAVERHRL